MRLRLLFIVCLFFICTSLTSSFAFAQENETASAVYIPPGLTEWREWVLYEQDHLFCPQQLQSHNDEEHSKPHICAWPITLDIQAFDDHAVFESHWFSYTDSEIPLPGSVDLWPEQVLVDGQAAVVTPNTLGRPSVIVAPGEHTLQGRINWTEIPWSLDAPAQSGVVQASLNGKPIVPLIRGTNGYIHLSNASIPKQEKDRTDIVVARLIQDGFPLTMNVYIDIDIYGQNREERIGPVVLPGFEIFNLESKLPVKINDDGSLQLQLQKGAYEIVVQLRATQVITQLQKPELPKPWPNEETWSFAPDLTLRTVRVESPHLADRTQVHTATGLPLDNAVYLLRDNDPFKLIELNRGITDFNNEISISRHTWLNLDGNTLINRDEVTGIARSDWRFNIQQPYRLLSAEDQDLLKDKHLLITQFNNALNPSQLDEGVEWRNPNINMAVTMQTEFTHTTPLSAWQHTVDKLNTTLQLPPGYRLLHATGYDQVRGSWLSRWDIFSVFLLILTTTVVFRLLSWPQALASFVLLSLGMHEFYAPTLLLLISALLLLLNQWVEQKKGQKLINKITLAAILLLAIQIFFFTLNQLQSALYPQLETETITLNLDTEAKSYPLASLSPKVDEEDFSLDRIQVTGSRIASPGQALTINDPNAHLQAGKGIPDWEWNRYHLYRNGPIAADEQQTLFILKPWQQFIVRIALVISGLYLLFYLARLCFPKVTLPTALLISAVGLLAPSMVSAQDHFPSDKQLSDLQARLVQQDRCMNHCTSLSQVSMSDSQQGELITLSGTIHSAANTSFLLPKNNTEYPWAIQSLMIDGHIAPVYKRDSDYLIPVSPGIHQLTMTVYAQRFQQLSFTFADRQTYFDIDLEHWQDYGLANHRLNNNTLTLNRRAIQQTAVESNASNYQIKPFIKVERVFSLGLDPHFDIKFQQGHSNNSAIHVEYPLYPDELFLRSSAEAKDDNHRIKFTVEPDDIQHIYTEIPLLDHYEFAANSNPDIAEQWSIVVSPLLHVEFEGSTPLATPSDHADWGHLYYFFKPTAGETLSIKVARPQAIPGNTIAIQNATHHSSVGRNFSESTLNMELIVTRAGNYRIPFPDDAELLHIAINDTEAPVQVIDGALEIPISTNTNTIDIQWRQKIDNHWHLQTPALDLQQPMANITTVIDAPEERWLLWVYGDGIGPALRFWSLLAFMFVVAFALSRIQASPLAFHQWLLLGFGFSVVHSWWFVWIVGFFFILAKRRSSPPNFEHQWRSRAIQTAFILLSVITFILLIATVANGLLSKPDMHISNPLSYYEPLHWYQDISSGALPSSGVISVPMWFYRVAMLLWALWFSLQFVQWLRWTWGSLNAGGFWPEAKRASQKAPTASSENPEHNE
jgi:hypothetical protein